MNVGAPEVELAPAIGAVPRVVMDDEPPEKRLCAITFAVTEADRVTVAVTEVQVTDATMAQISVRTPPALDAVEESDWAIFVQEFVSLAALAIEETVGVEVPVLSKVTPTMIVSPTLALNDVPPPTVVPAALLVSDPPVPTAAHATTDHLPLVVVEVEREARPQLDGPLAWRSISSG